MIKIDCLATGVAQRVVGAVLVIFLCHRRTICTILQWEARADYLKKIPLTLLTNEKQENLVYVHTANIIKQISFRVNRKKYGNGSVNSEEHLKN
jgi:hypothetical protein